MSDFRLYGWQQRPTSNLGNFCHILPFYFIGTICIPSVEGLFVFCLYLTCLTTTVGETLFPWDTVSCASLFNHPAAVICSTLSHRQFPVTSEDRFSDCDKPCWPGECKSQRFSDSRLLHDIVTLSVRQFVRLWIYIYIGIWYCINFVVVRINHMLLYVFQLSAHDALILSQPVSTPLPLRYHCYYFKCMLL